jgi:hypothetical protein
VQLKILIYNPVLDCEWSASYNSPLMPNSYFVRHMEMTYIFAYTWKSIPLYLFIYLCPLPQYAFMAWCLVKAQGRTTLPLPLSRDGSVGIALGYGLDDRGTRVRFSVGSGNFSLHHRVQNGSGAHPASYPGGTGGSFLGDKATGAWSWPLTSI